MTPVVAVLGANLCGWIAAAALARRLPRSGYRVLAIDAGAPGDGLGDFAPVIAVPPTLAAFHADIGLDDAALVAAGGGYALGIGFAGWRGDGAAAFLGYGETGAPLEGVAFRQLAGRLRAAGTSVRLADYSLAALAAQAGRFAPSAPIAHALHLDVERYTEAMRAAAFRAGAETATAPLRDLRIGDQGIVEELTLADGKRVEPLLVLDCSGAAAIAASRIDPGFEDWSDWLPCDHALAEIVPADGAPPPYSQVEALDAGWSASWPIEGSDARLACRQGGNGRVFRNGRRAAAWRGNCVALGAAACVLEPLHPTALTLLLRSLARLIQLWPAARNAPVSAAAFNRAAAGEQARARDFLVGQYAAAGRAGAFWDARRAAALPEPLAAKRDLFAARGRLPMFDDEPFEEEDWAAMFDAMGLVPRRHDALADLLSIAAIERHLAEHRTRIIDVVRGLPPYAHTLGLCRRAVA